MNKRVIVGLGVVAVAGGLAYYLTRSGNDPAPSSTTASGRPSAGATGAGSGTAVAPPEPGRVVGSVRDSEGSAGIAGAVVQLVPAADDSDLEPMSARTDGSGRYTIAGVVAGDYAIAAAADGYLPQVGGRVTVDPGSEATFDLTLRSGGNQVSGSVADVSGGPIADAVVRFEPMPGVLASERTAGFAAMTGVDGRFAVNVADGLYRAVADHVDYVASTQRVEIRGGARTVDFALTPGGVVEGTVLMAATGEPVPHAMISYVSERVVAMPGMGAMTGGGRRGLTAAGADGRFRITGLSSGALRLTARGGGGGTPDDTIVQLAIGETVTGVELLLDRARAIRGVVVDADSGAPVADLMVSGNLGMGGGIRAVAPTGSDGRFEIVDVVPGSYRLAADGGDYLATGFGTPVTVGDTDVDDVTVRVGRGFHLRGRVEPAAVADVSLRMEDERSIGRGLFQLGAVRTDADGRFDLGPVAPGEHTLEAQAADGRTGTVSATLADSDVDGLVITLEPGASVEGRVVDASGAPVTDAVVSLKRQRANRRVTMVVNGRDLTARQSPTHSDGSFRIRGLEAGSYALSVIDGQHQQLSWADGAGDRSPRPLTIADGEQKRDLVLRVEARDGVIRGVAIGPDGAPLADVWVAASPTARMPFAMPEPPAADDDGGAGADGTMESHTAMVVVEADGDEGGDALPPALTGEDGRFVIRNLRAGKYDLVGQGLQGGARGFMRGVETGSDVTLPLSSLGTIKGTVTMAGQPVPAFRVELSGESWRAKSVRDRDGRFTLKLVDPGTHTLKVHGGGGSAEIEVTLAPGGTQTVAVALERLVAVTGKVVDPSGKPVVGSMVVTVPDRGDGRMSIGIESDDAPPTTGEDGSFRVSVKPGNYRLLVLGTDSPMPVAMKPIQVGTDDVDLGTITAGSQAGPGHPPGVNPG